MNEIRIVCAHDAVPLAEMLTRLLEAEEHRVRLSFGRQALHDLEDENATRGVVLLIWSPNARSQTYMIEWARAIAPSHLIEIAQNASDWPSIKRAANVIDFTNWRGQRGARCWKLFNERLDAVIHALTPQKIPLRTIAAISAASLAAVSTAVVVGLHTAAQPETTIEVAEDLETLDPNSGVGGPLSAIEPASMGDDDLILRHYPDVVLIDAQPSEPLADLPDLGSIELRDPTLWERINAYNPLRQDRTDSDQ